MFTSLRLCLLASSAAMLGCGGHAPPKFSGSGGYIHRAVLPEVHQVSTLPTEEHATTARDERLRGATQPTTQPARAPAFIVEVTDDPRVFVRPPKDKDGRLPRDVVVAFLKDVAVGDIEGARSWWIGERPYPFQGDKPRFGEFIGQLRSMDRVVVKRTGQGKKPYYYVDWDPYRDSKPARMGDFGPKLYYLRLVDGRWKILRWFHW